MLWSIIGTPSKVAGIRPPLVWIIAAGVKRGHGALRALDLFALNFLAVEPIKALKCGILAAEA